MAEAARDAPQEKRHEFTALANERKLKCESREAAMLRI